MTSDGETLSTDLIYQKVATDLGDPMESARRYQTPTFEQMWEQVLEDRRVALAQEAAAAPTPIDSARKAAGGKQKRQGGRNNRG
jgi:hypothetical protein